MSFSQKTEGDKSVLQWGGLAGMLGSILYILVFVFVGVFVGLEPNNPADWIKRFPDIRAARIVENGLFLGVQILWVFHFLALNHALRGKSLAPALFGSSLGILGLVLLAAEALPHIAQAAISDLYHAPGATPENQATLVLLWETTQGIIDMLLITGFLLLPIGVILLGIAMLRDSAFGKGFGGMSVVLGLLGVAAAILLMVDPASQLGAFSNVFTLIGFHFIVGWKVYRLSRVA